MFRREIATLIMLLAGTLLPIGCKKPIQEGYRVVGYDAETKHWTISRNGTFDGRYLTKRMTVVCTFWRWGDREASKGPDACHLQVGRLLVPHPLVPPDDAGEFLMVDELPNETLSIMEGSGADRTMQQFNILKYEVVTNEPAK